MVGKRHWFQTLTRHTLLLFLVVVSMPRYSLAQTPSASAGLYADAAPAPDELNQLSGPYADPTAARDATRSNYWICEGAAASPESWYTAEALLTLSLGSTVLQGTVFYANTSGNSASVAANVSAGTTTQLLTCSISVALNNCPGCGASDSDSVWIEADCGDERTTMIEEYRAGQVAYTPSCSSFASSGSTTHFSWSEFNGNFSTGNPHSPWGIVLSSLKTGLEDTRSAYNRGGLILESGYRCPHGNAAVGGAYQSRHMWGDAGDVYSQDHSWNQSEWDLVADAAQFAGATFIEPYSQDPSHVHADWR